jgi:4-alpha-glucanotransferase
MQEAAWGIERSYEDHTGELRDVPDDTIRALLGEMGADGEPPASPVRTCGPGDDTGMRGELRLEGGGAMSIDGVLPPEVPFGYHDLLADTGDSIRLIVSPRRCHLPRDLRIWGWSAQLYATRSARSWGMGDLADLRTLAEWTGERSGGVVLVNPLHAALPSSDAQQPSPYSPSSRCARNPLYLRIEEVPGAELLGDELERLSIDGRRLNGSERIDRASIHRHKLGALEAIHQRLLASGGLGTGFDTYVREAGDTLAGYAAYCALHEEHGVDWRTWPSEVRHPDSPAVAAFVAERHERVRFHQWVQWLVDRQLADASHDVAIVQDLAVGVDPAGADAWLWQDVFADGVSVGAPPDEFNQAGQDWGFSPFDPWRLRAEAYEPFVQTMRAALRHAGGLRVDHVMGMARLWWIPRGRGPTEGAYVRYPCEELLDVLALESHRAGAWIVGEDLGTVEETLREELAERRILSYRLVYFEQRPPSSFPEQSLGAVSTHDLPTLAGLWTGEDLARQREIGLAPNDSSTKEMRDRIGRWAGLDDDASVHDVVLGVHRMLADAPSAVVTATLDDVACATERPNHPGSQDPANWSTPLPCPLEDLMDSSLAQRVADLLQEGRT